MRGGVSPGRQLRGERASGRRGSTQEGGCGGIRGVGRARTRDEAGRLADGRVLRQVLNADLDGEIRRETLLRIDLQHVAPLGEARALRVRLGRALGQVVDAHAPRLRVAERASSSPRDARLGVALVELDAGNHAIFGDHVNELLAVLVLLEERLDVQDHARDVLAQPRGGVEHRAVGGAALGRVGDFGGLDVAGTQPRASRLIGGKEALAGRREGVGGRLERCLLCDGE